MLDVSLNHFLSAPTNFESLSKCCQEKGTKRHDKENGASLKFRLMIQSALKDICPIAFNRLEIEATDK